jgi:hypothetical protein
MVNPNSVADPLGVATALLAGGDVVGALVDF